jgi:sugar phosphate isomerase/epimerase
MIGIAAMVGTADLTQDTLAVYRGDLDSAFGKLAALGFDGVELMTKDPSALDGDKINSLLDKHKLELVGFCTGHVFGEDGLGLVGPNPDVEAEAMARLKSFVDFTARHCKRGTLINIGRSRGPGLANEAETTLARMEEKFRELADYAAPHGIEWVLEPINAHQAPYIHTTQEGIEMVRRVNRPNFGLMMDVYHINIEDKDLYDGFREAKDVLKFVHFADNNRKSPGSAHLDFGKFVDVLNEIGYDGFVSLEILPLPDGDTAARVSIEHLRKYIPRQQEQEPTDNTDGTDKDL